jgi:uncharacterized protein YnzC (UPF0291/DUF896 family)
MTQEARIQRINALAKKAKTEGLTPEEQAEREQLRQDYLKDFRASLTAQLDNTWVVGPDGVKRKLEKKKKK